VTDEHGVAGGTGQHTDHGQPDVGRALRRVPTIADTKHVRQRLEQCPRVLLVPVGSLQEQSHSYDDDATHRCAVVISSLYH